MLQYVYGVATILSQNLSGTELYRINFFFGQVSYIQKYVNYLVNDDESSIIELYELIKAEPTQNNTDRQLQNLLPALCQIKEYDKVLELCEANKNKNLFLDSIIAYAFLAKGDYKKSFHSFISCFEKTELLAEDSCNNAIIAIELGFKERITDTFSLYDTSFRHKVYTNDTYRVIIHVSCLYFQADDERKLIIREEIESIDFNILSVALKDHVCKILTSIGEYEKSNEYLNTYLDTGKESQTLYLYIKNLYHLKKEHSQQLTLLKHWRQNFTPLEELLALELNLNQQLNRYSEIEEICKSGCKHFPSNPIFLFNLIVAFSKNSNPEITLFLTEDLLKIKFYWEHAFILGIICIDNQLYELGIKIIYPYAKYNNDNATIRQRYFSILTIHANNYRSPEINKVEIGTTVRALVNSKTQIIHLTSENIETSELISALLGKTKQEEFTFRENNFGKETKVLIEDVFNQYDGLLAEIIEEIKSHRSTGYTIKSFSFTSGDLDQLNQLFIEEWGAEGEFRKLTIEDGFEKYIRGQISFMELVRRTDQHKAFEIYNMLTRESNYHYRIPPVKIFEKNDFRAINEFVIDISVLPIISKYKSYPKDRGFQFVVSQHLIDFLKDKITEVTMLPEEPMTLSISLSGVRPQSYAPGYKQKFLTELNGMLTWIDENCITAFAPEKLDVLLSEPSRLYRNDWYFQYFIDNLFLSLKENRCLMTDDIFYYQETTNKSKPITFEHFIKINYTEKIDFFTDLFVRNNYVGVTLSSSQLQKYFDEKPIIESKGVFNICLKNLPFETHRDPKHIMQVIKLIGHIYSLDLNRDYKHRLAEALFVEALKGYPYTQQRLVEIQTPLSQSYIY